jgi:hypothetical protein
MEFDRNFGRLVRASCSIGIRPVRGTETTAFPFATDPKNGYPAKVSMRSIWLALLIALLAAPSASAQRACRHAYRAGEYVPPGCQARQSPGAPVYQSWGGNFGSGTPNLPHAPGAAHDWRYFGGYNALYGFGR